MKRFLPSLAALFLGSAAPFSLAAGGQNANITVPPELAADARAAKDAFEHSDYLGAQKTYERMLNNAPDNVYILSNLGVVYFRTEKWKLAEEPLKKAISVAPGDVFSYRTLGIVYYQEKRFDDSINSLTRALAINPKDRDSWAFLVCVYLAQQPPNTDMARKCYKRAIELGAEPDQNIEQPLKLPPSPHPFPPLASNLACRLPSLPAL